MSPMHFAVQIISNDIAQAGDVVEAANENIAQEEQSRFCSDEVVRRTAQKPFPDVNRKVSPDEHCTDLRPNKRIERLRCNARTSRFYAAGRAITANSSLPQATATRVITSHRTKKRMMEGSACKS